MRYHLLSLIIGCAVAGSVAAQAPVSPATEQFVTAQVQEITSSATDTEYGFERLVQVVKIRIQSGPEAGKVIDMENGVLNGRDDMALEQGERVILRSLTYADGRVQYLLAEKYRLPALGGILIGFVVLVLLLSGITGLRSFLGLVVSVVILTFGLVPAIVHGWNPLLVSLVTAVIIACSSLYLAHGFTFRTSVALCSTLGTLVLSTIFAIAAVHVAHLFGMGSEESIFLQSGTLSALNLRGLLLGGIVIGCLGVLDDITTAQTAAVDEIWRVNPSLTKAQVARSAASIGREHIASLINTLALAYAGASLPLLLLFQINDTAPLWVILNNESLAEEIIRTLVGSATLLLAVPISTWVAVQLLPRGGSDTHSGHHHVHHH